MAPSEGRKRKEAVVEDKTGSHKKHAKEGMVRATRRAAQNLSYDERIAEPIDDEGVMQTIVYTECETEKQALEQTNSLPGRERRLYKFEFFDERGELQPLESRLRPLFISGVIQPLNGDATKKTGRYVRSFGPLIQWSVLYEAAGATIRVFTDEGAFRCVKPTAKFQPLFAHLREQVIVAHQVYLQLAPGVAGSDATASFDTVLQHLQRSKVRHGYGTWRQAVSTNAEFLLEQMKAMSSQHEAEGFCFGETPFGLALQEQRHVRGLMHDGGGVQIEEAALGGLPLDADELLARQLQAKEDARGVMTESSARNAVPSLISVSEEDIASDYPLSTVYEKQEEETDEFLMADEDIALIDPAYFPQRLLTDFAIYDSEGVLKSLELLPCWSGLPPTVELYGSGIVKEEGDFSESAHFPAEQGASAQGASSSGEAPGEGSSSAVCGRASGEGSATLCRNSEASSMRLYLSQIQEYAVECGAESVSVAIRTEASWYKLQQPSLIYAPWFDVVIKYAQVAIKIIGMLLNEARACKLSFPDVAAALSREGRDSEVFLASHAEQVTNLLITHGPFILNQFEQCPYPKIRNCAFATYLRDQVLTRMNCRSLLVTKKDARRPTRPKSSCMSLVVNKNPMKDRLVNIRAKSMPASATLLVQSIWKNYFSVNGLDKETVKIDDLLPEEEAVGDVDMTESEADVKGGGQPDPENASRSPTVAFSPIQPAELSLAGNPTAQEEGLLVFSSAIDGDGRGVKCGDVVACLDDADVYSSAKDSVGKREGEEALSKGSLGMVQCFLRHEDLLKSYVQLRAVVKGRETVLGDAASSHELFLQDEWVILDLENVSLPLEGISVLECGAWEGGWKGEGSSVVRASDHFIIKLIYKPEQGQFVSATGLQLGKLHVDEATSEERGVKLTGEGNFLMSGTQYRIGDCVYFDPRNLEDSPKPDAPVDVPNYVAATGRDPKGSVRKMRPYGIGRILSIETSGSSKAVKSVRVQRYYRPEDALESHESTSDFWEVYSSKEELEIHTEDIVRKCRVSHDGTGGEIETFSCTKRIQLTENGRFDFVDLNTEEKQAVQAQPAEKPQPELAAGALKTLDIFAGCGGLSEGMHQAGVADTKWAIEYEEAAAEAFRLNHPDAAVLCCNVSALLYRVMSAHGQPENCSACSEVQQQAAKIPDHDINCMPKPGEVDFMVGGPPCQGYSGMNRFNKGQWSMMQNSMVMNYLSYADYYRPRYFLLENVRNFVSHNSSRTFRLTLRTLIEMGYQVRFGVLNAGNYGVPQSRKRTFIWAASAKEVLPDWPMPLHVFHSPQLTINLPGGVKYAVGHDTRGASLRAVTVQDAISDLPPILNGADAYCPSEMRAPRRIRGEALVLRDHICKRLSDLNLERCKCIPKNTPGADWRTLQEIVAADPSREKFQGHPLVPWCLPNTAARHNNWRGLFGRLDKRGHFPTSTTDPQPMGKVGQVFHPEQDRIVSVRECARSQGFPDSYRFYGTIHQKHKQVGNAVPPPLASALGSCLKKALQKAEMD